MRLLVGVQRAQVLVVRVRVEELVLVILLLWRGTGWNLFHEFRGEGVSRANLWLPEHRSELVALFHGPVRVLAHEDAEVAFEEDLAMVGEEYQNEIPVSWIG